MKHLSENINEALNRQVINVDNDADEVYNFGYIKASKSSIWLEFYPWGNTKVENPSLITHIKMQLKPKDVLNILDVANEGKSQKFELKITHPQLKRDIPTVTVDVKDGILNISEIYHIDPKNKEDLSCRVNVECLNELYEFLKTL